MTAFNDVLAWLVEEVVKAMAELAMAATIAAEKDFMIEYTDIFRTLQCSHSKVSIPRSKATT
jgi:hypothetical protein